MIHILKDRKEATVVRREASQALGEMGDGKAVTPLIAIITNQMVRHGSSLGLFRAPLCLIRER